MSLVRNRLYWMVENMKAKLSDNEYKTFLEELQKIQDTDTFYTVSLIYSSCHFWKTDIESSDYETSVVMQPEVVNFKIMSCDDMDEFYDGFYQRKRGEYNSVPTHVCWHFLPPTERDIFSRLINGNHEGGEITSSNDHVLLKIIKNQPTGRTNIPLPLEDDSSLDDEEKSAGDESDTDYECKNDHLRRNGSESSD